MITIKQKPAQIIVPLLKEKGYFVVDNDSHLRAEIVTGYTVQSSLFLGTSESRRSDVIFDLWFICHGANEKKWVIEVYGKHNVEKVKQLCQELQEKFAGIDFEIVVETEGDYKYDHNKAVRAFMKCP